MIGEIMRFNTKLLLICLILVLFNIVAVSASDANLADDGYLDSVNQSDKSVSIDFNLNTNQSENDVYNVLTSSNAVSNDSSNNIAEKDNIPCARRIS